MKNRQGDKWQWSQQADNRRKFLMQTQIVPNRLFDHIPLLGRYSRMLRWRVGNKVIPNGNENECENWCHIKSNFPSIILDENAKHHPSDDISNRRGKTQLSVLINGTNNVSKTQELLPKCSSQQRCNKTALFIRRRPEWDEIMECRKDCSLEIELERLKSLCCYCLAHQQWMRGKLTCNFTVSLPLIRPKRFCPPIRSHMMMIIWAEEALSWWIYHVSNWLNSNNHWILCKLIHLPIYDSA